MNLSGAALVVGGRGGIGAATVGALEHCGVTVVVLDMADGVDGADEEAVDRFLLRRAPAQGFRYYVHLAGRVGRGGIQDLTLPEWQAVMDSNLTSAFVCVRAVLPFMTQAGAAIVLMSSVNARTGGNRLSGPGYAVAKAGINVLTWHLAADLAARTIRVNAVAPGPVQTTMLDRLEEDELNALVDSVPLHRITPTNEIASAILFLLSDEAASITGHVLDINGGLWMG